MESQKKRKPKGSHLRRRQNSISKFDLATDLTYATFLYWNWTLGALAVTAVILAVVFLINRSVTGTMTAAGIISLVLGGLVLSRGRPVGALMLILLGIAIIIVAGRL